MLFETFKLCEQAFVKMRIYDELNCIKNDKDRGYGYFDHVKIPSWSPRQIGDSVQQTPLSRPVTPLAAESSRRGAVSMTGFQPGKEASSKPRDPSTSRISKFFGKRKGGKGKERA